MLRRFTPADVDNLVRLDADPEVMCFVTGGISTAREEIEQEVLPAFLVYYQRYQRYGFWATIEKSTGEFLGWSTPALPREPPPRRPNSATGCAGQPGARGTPQKGRAR
jgi:RimJ/RimL family protein N-acetyltransferase